MKGYWTDSYYVGIFPDGHREYFVSDQEYREEYRSRYPEEE